MSNTENHLYMNNPPHPGGILLNLFMRPLHITTQKLAEKTALDLDKIELIILEKEPITPIVAERLAEAFNNNAQFWLNIQKNYEYWRVKR